MNSSRGLIRLSKNRRLLKKEDIEETQKKYAEHLSKRTGESQEAIEKGREEFLRRSAEGLPEQYKPPYGAVSWYESFLEMAQTQKLEVVDTEFISVNIVDSHYAPQILRGLKFLGLLDESNRATDKLRSLRILGDEYKVALRDIVKNAYRDVFSTVVLQKASMTSLVNFFMQKYDFGASIAKQVAQVFVMLCKKAEIELPFVSPAYETTVMSRQSTSRKPTPKKSVTETKREEAPQLGLHEIKYGKIQIFLPEGDLDAASEAIQLINLYIKRLEKAKNAEDKSRDFIRDQFFGTSTKK
jgi:hypothetical protein